MTYGAIGSIGAPPAPLEAKVRNDEAFKVIKDDPAMTQARERGRATLPQFLAALADPPAGSRSYAVKIAVADRGNVEWFWINNLRRSGDRFTDTVNNTPRLVSNVREGQTMNFGRNDIADRMYVRNGQMRGNFTACALLARAPQNQREKLMRKFGMTRSA